MKTRSLWAAALVAGCFAWPAQAAVQGFTGPFAPGTWTTTTTGTITGGSGGTASISNNILTLVGGNGPTTGNSASACVGGVTGFAGPCQINFLTTTVMNPFAFDWTYTTVDSEGPGSDLFGLLIDGVRLQLSDPGGAITQTGHRSVSAGSSFGFYINCTDCIEGAATASIANFQAGAIPEPGTIALLGPGVMFAGGARRRLRASESATAALSSGGGESANR